jgi:hypothetical protein
MQILKVKYGSGRPIDPARSEAMATHGRPVERAIKKSERLKALNTPALKLAGRRRASPRSTAGCGGVGNSKDHVIVRGKPAS